MSPPRRSRERALLARPRARAPEPARPAPARAPVPESSADPAPPLAEPVPSWASAPGSPFGFGAGDMEDAAADVIRRKGPGRPLAAPTRTLLESHLGADLGRVRVHDDPAARASAAALGARAFTHGSDVWLGPGESPGNVALMAHEATHVVQQAGGVHRLQRTLVQRQTPPAGGAAGGTPATGTTPGTGTGGAAQQDPLRIPRLQIPTIKVQQLDKTTDVDLGPATERGDQRQRWINEVRPAVASKVGDLLQGKEGIRRDQATGNVASDTDAATTANKTYFFHIGSGAGGGEQDQYIIGGSAQLIEELTIPRWDQQGRPRSMDVDHRKELQMGGLDEKENYWLLDSAANRSSGSRIKNALDRAIEAASRADPRFSPTPRTREQLQSANVPIKIDRIDGGGAIAGSPDSHWEYREVANPAHQTAPFSKLTNVRALQLRTLNLLGSPTRLVIYPVSGGRRKEVPGWDANRGERGLWADFIRGIRQAHVSYRPGEGGEFTGIIQQRLRGRLLIDKNVRAALTEVAGLPFTTVIQRNDLAQSLRFAELNGLSPIEFMQVGVDADRGVLARGVVRPTIPVLRRGLEIDIVLEGDDLRMSKTFTKDDFAFPGPIRVTQAALTLGIGTESGLFAEGTVDFEIPRLGQGQIGARASTGQGFELHGQLTFDRSLFDPPAQISASYSDGRLHATGDLSIGEGRVRGVRSATLHVDVDGEHIVATGTVRPAVPGVESGTLSVDYSPNGGLVITGVLTLAANRAIQSGSLRASVTKRPDADRWAVSASGQAVPNIPGAAGQISVTYEDGAFDVNGSATYDRGMLHGTITVGATNRPVGPDGRPSGPPPAGGGAAQPITIYGGGSLTLRLAPWLQATAGVRLLPNGEIEVRGEIGLPAALDLFPEKRLDKNIFTIGIDIPIVGVAVAGQRIGIFANISGGLDLSAGIGPGQLQELHLGVTYNPAHEDQTHVTGGAKLHIPAQAGLRLFVRGSLGVGIPIVSAQAGLEIGGALGIQGALDAGVNVDWSPATGLDIQASAEVYAEPFFRFDITGFVLVEADLLLTTVELYSKRWQLASFRYGSGLRLGLRFPIHYHEGQPFDISLSDVQFEVPHIDPGDLLRGLIARIA